MSFSSPLQVPHELLPMRRLRLQLPLSQQTCSCGRPIDSLGHHRAFYTRTGALGRRGFALESAAARVCREAGGRVTTNVMVRDLDLPVLNATDSRRLEVVVDGIAVVRRVTACSEHDARVFSSLHSDGSPHRGAADTDGVVFPRARSAENCGTQSWWVQGRVLLWPIST